MVLVLEKQALKPAVLSEGSMPPYRTQETDPFGSASSKNFTVYLSGRKPYFFLGIIFST